MEGAKRKIHRLKSISRRRNGSGRDDPEPPAFVTSVNGASNVKRKSTSDLRDHDENRGRTTVAPQLILPSQNEHMALHVRGIPKSFVAKKAAILQALAVEGEGHSDKSPKGSVDEGVREVIALVNGVDEEEETGWVTTSSCAGRVSVFVEGGRGSEKGEAEGDGGVLEDEANEGEHKDMPEVTSWEQPNGELNGGHEQVNKQSKVKTGPGGKGGGKWLYVSHDPIPSQATATHAQEGYYTKLFGLEPFSSTTLSQPTQGNSSPRLIHLSFSPLILHILCATLHHARPLLAAAINAGFRESGVQSLKALEDEDAGVMVGVRTAGLVFESVIGVVLEDENGNERYQSVVSEEYMKMCVGVVNGRFEWNERRRGMLIAEVRKAVDRNGDGEEEGKEERRVRKREEGLKRQAEVTNDDGGNKNENEKDEVDGLGEGLEVLEVR